VRPTYGSWRSPITSDLIVAQITSLSDVRLAGDDIYWLEGRPQEQGRNVIVRPTRTYHFSASAPSQSSIAVLQQGRKSTNIYAVSGAIPGNLGSNGTHAGPCGCMSATQDAKIWFVSFKGKRYGPYTFSALVHEAERGLVDREAGVWCLGWTEWRIARNVPGLFEPAPETKSIGSPGPLSEPEPTGHGGGVRLAIVSVLAVLLILLGAGWAAISLCIIRVTFMF
jgi:hypothetical protein